MIPGFFRSKIALFCQRVAGLPVRGYVTILAPACTKRRSPVVILPGPVGFVLPSHLPNRFSALLKKDPFLRSSPVPTCQWPLSAFRPKPALQLDAERLPRITLQCRFLEPHCP